MLHSAKVSSHDSHHRPHLLRCETMLNAWGTQQLAHDSSLPLMCCTVQRSITKSLICSVQDLLCIGGFQQLCHCLPKPSTASQAQLLSQ
jgi:hypothetical protein